MHHQLSTQLIVAIFCRFLLKTGRRIVYPFAAIISAALGVSLAAVTVLLALNQIAALLSPFFGQLSDRWGYRKMMVRGMIAASLAMLAIGLLPHYNVLLLGLLVIGLGISICDPALHAYIGTKVPFARRGQAVGVSELAWAASSLVGIPAASWLVQGFDWNTPFVAIGALGVGGSLMLHRVLPCREATPHVAVSPIAAPSWLAVHRDVLHFPAAKTMLFYAFLAGCACDIFFVTYALWLTESLKIGVVALGLATIAIGVAELSGELLTATLADRIGLRRTVRATLLLAAVSFALLPWWNFSTAGTLTGIFLACLSIEFSFVAAMSLCTEVHPGARATMMSMFQASSGMGHVVGVLIGGLVWFAGGITGVGLVCAALCLVAFVIVLKGLRHWRATTTIATTANVATTTAGSNHTAERWHSNQHGSAPFHQPNS